MYSHSITNSLVIHVVISMIITTNNLQISRYLIQHLITIKPVFKTSLILPNQYCLAKLFYIL